MENRLKNPRLTSIIGALDAAVSDGLKRLEPKNAFWQKHDPQPGRMVTPGRVIVGQQKSREGEIPRLVGQVGASDFRVLDRRQKALVAVAQEFVWGEQPQQHIVKHQQSVEVMHANGEHLNELEQTLIRVRRIDTDMF